MSGIESSEIEWREAAVDSAANFRTNPTVLVSFAAAAMRLRIVGDQCSTWVEEDLVFKSCY